MSWKTFCIVLGAAFTCMGAPAADARKAPETAPAAAMNLADPEEDAPLADPPPEAAPVAETEWSFRISGEAAACGVRLTERFLVANTWGLDMSQNGCRIGKNGGTWQFRACMDTRCIVLMDEDDQGRKREVLVLSGLPAVRQSGATGAIMVQADVDGLKTLDTWYLY